MALNPLYGQMKRIQTFSSVAKDLVYIPIQLDNSYPAGGYSLTSDLLFKEPGFSFVMVDGYATDSSSYVHVIHDKNTNKLQVLTTAHAETAGGTDLSTFVAHCTFARW